jgi:hypothetical protein
VRPFSVVLHDGLEVVHDDALASEEGDGEGRLEPPKFMTRRSLHMNFSYTKENMVLVKLASFKINIFGSLRFSIPRPVQTSKYNLLLLVNWFKIYIIEEILIIFFLLFHLYDGLK